MNHHRHHNHNMPSQVNSDIPPSSASVVMLSAPDTQDNPQDAFHTPPEQPSFHSSDVSAVPHSAGSRDPSYYSVFLDEIKNFSEGGQLGFGEDFPPVKADGSCKDIPMDKNSVTGENAVNDDDCSKHNRSSCEIGEGSRNANRSSGEGGEVSESLTVFDVLRYLANTTKKVEDDGLPLLESLKRAGVKFPRPSCWSDDMKSELFNFDDEEQKK